MENDVNVVETSSASPVILPPLLSRTCAPRTTPNIKKTGLFARFPDIAVVGVGSEVLGRWERAPVWRARSDGRN